MYLPYTQRRNRWVIEVTYASGAVRTFGPIKGKLEAEAFLRSRMLAAGDVSPRAVDIQAARVLRSRRRAWGEADDLLGVRFRLV